MQEFPKRRALINPATFFVGIYIDSSLFPMSNHLYRHYTIEEIQSNCGDYQIILVMGRVRNYTYNEILKKFALIFDWVVNIRK